MKKTGILNSIIFFFVPSWMLNSTPWKDIWIDTQKEKFVRTTRLSMPILGVGYLLHYFFVDTPLGLTVDGRWLYYRVGIFAISMVTFGASFVKIKNSVNVCKLLFWVTALVTGWAQANSMLWYSGVSSTWAFFISISLCMFYRAEPINVIAMLTLLMLVQWPSFELSHQNINLIWGSVIVSYLIIGLVVKGRSDEIESFIMVQRQIDMEKTLAEVQQSLADQVRAFMPKKINEKIQFFLRNGYTVTQAIDEVLRARNATVAVLFSDIRGYTQSSKNQTFIRDRALPNIKNCTSIVESYGGVPRLIGDLVFAYFEIDQQQNVEEVYSAAVEILKSNKLQNENSSLETHLTRYVVLDFGNVTCGNLGGVDSSREITALGIPVNRASRIDQLTKSKILKDHLGDQAIIMTSDFIRAATERNFRIPALPINLIELSLVIRDFENESELFIVNTSEIYGSTGISEAA
jgi:class 3 adenylate cyclase